MKLAWSSSSIHGKERKRRKKDLTHPGKGKKEMSKERERERERKKERKKEKDLTAIEIVLLPYAAEKEGEMSRMMKLRFFFA